MPLREALREAWEMARGRPPVLGQLRAYPVEVERLGARAVLSPKGHLGLLLPVSAGEQSQIPQALQPGQGRVLEAEIAVFSEGSERARAFTVWCREPALDESFVSFGEALLELWGGGTDPVSAADTCHAQFRQLLAGPKAIDKVALVGLIGELLFLSDLVTLAPGAIDTWCADAGERHDFRRGNHGVEVKATLRSLAAGPVVHISSIDQLDPPVGGALYLHLIQLEQVAVGEITLPALVARLTSQVGAHGAERLGARLERFGLASSSGAIPSFAILGRHTWRVDPSFPRLTVSRLSAGQLDVGIRAVEYDLDLSTCRPFMVDIQVALSALLRSGEGG